MKIGQRLRSLSELVRSEYWRNGIFDEAALDREMNAIADALARLIRDSKKRRVDL